MPPVLHATRLGGAEIRIDGKLDEEAWEAAPAASGFVQIDPREGAPASERSRVRVLYGDDALYVGFRAFDSRPDSIVGQLTRRDQHSYSDQVRVLVDSYFDRRTAFEFGVNPRGVKQDTYRYDDTRQDRSWDAVWEVATSVDEGGWTAEFRIPYSQLRFAGGPEQTWGVNFIREIARRQETVAWAPISRQASGWVSRSGQLRGIRDLEPARRMEVLPYTVARATRAPGDAEDPFYQETDLFGGVGADLKYGVTSDLTLDLTLNPDFGQVEADPGQLNLSAFETFLPEKRPFFIEGASIFSFGLGTGGGIESLFYSRRIGRRPQGWADPGEGGFQDQPENTTILGAWKLSGKTSSGWSVGALHALTGEERGRVVAADGSRWEEAVEPRTNYGVVRLQKDFREGRSAVGVIGTGTVRDPDVADDLGLRTDAWSGGVDFRHRFGGEDYQVAAFLLGSRVGGSPEAIEGTQRSAAHYFQRSDQDHKRLDPSRTSLEGWASQVFVSKVGGGFWRFSTGLQSRSPGFEVNDLGFMNEADFVNPFFWVGYQHTTPTEHLQSWYLNVNGWGAWDFGGLRTSTGGNVNGSFLLRSYWGGWGGVGREVENYSNTLLRGGPAFREEPRTNGWFGWHSDSRRPVQLDQWNNWSRRAQSDSWSWNSGASVSWRPSGRTTVSLGPSVTWNVEDRQWMARVTPDDDRDHFVFGRLDQTTFAVTGRLDHAFSPDLTLQVYAQPFVTSGSYDELKRVADPRAERYADRFEPLDAVAADDGEAYEVDLDGDGSPESFSNPDFNVKQFRSNLVLRWEYRPGSRIFVVWSSARDHNGPDGRFDLGRDLGDLFGSPGRNVLMVKVDYWLNP